MRFVIPPRIRVLWAYPSSRAQRKGALFAAALLASGVIYGNFPAPASAQPASSQTTQRPVQAASPAHAHKAAKSIKPAPAPEPPPPPPAPNWPVNESPGRASVIWDSQGLRIEASNSSLQQILKDVSVETGAKVEGVVPDQRVYGSYGPGQARDVISQLLQGSGYNVLLAGDLGSGAPRQIVLSQRRAGAPAPGTAEAPSQDNNPDDEIPDNSEVEEQPQPPPQQPIPMQPNPNLGRPGFGPNGPIRTPQQVMEEMQRQQLLQQQQQQQQDNQPANPPE